MTIRGKDLIALGFETGPELGRALEHVNRAGLTGDALAAWVAENRPAPRIRPQDPADPILNIEAETEAEVANVAAVHATMATLSATPTVRAAAVMPDACPAGPNGTIPVGGVVVAEDAIHPGMHSADICCSVMVTDFGTAEPGVILDAIHQATHFGPGGRPESARMDLPKDLDAAFRGNAFLNDQKILETAKSHLGTQGDGNHFAYVGRSEATGATCLVTHHGSRGPGAGLYKRGMRAAERHRQTRTSGVLKQNAWIPASSDEGRAYWDALQVIRTWTKTNHTCLHDRAAEIAGAEVRDRVWNEHNFVFRKGDLYYHAKGATPIDRAMLPDAGAVQIVPLNMAEPVLLIRGEANAKNLGFAPHGAGRNMSRSAHKRAQAGRREAEIFAEETAGLDVRFYSGQIDVSELPSAYKPAGTVRAQMERFGLAEVVDEIRPYGSIMAGDWERDAPWRKKRAAKATARAVAS